MYYYDVFDSLAILVYDVERSLQPDSIVFLLGRRVMAVVELGISSGYAMSSHTRPLLYV